MHIKDNVVIITGASSGIGAATVQAFGAAGARVVLVARDAAALERVAAPFSGTALVCPADVTDADACQRVVTMTLERFGRIDILVNNAGIGLASPAAEIARNDLEQVLAVNLIGPLMLTQAVLPQMRRQGSGRIVNVSSTIGVFALPYLGGYAASKAALDRMTEALRMELRGSGIGVTLVRPGTTRTGFRTHRLGEGSEERRVSPSGVPPERVAQVIVRAVERDTRRVYVSWKDQLMTAFTLIAPRLAEWALARAFRWKEHS